MNIDPGSVAGAANKASVSGGFAALYGGWTANEFAAFGGLLIAAIGLIVQWYFKRKDDRRKAEEHTARMAVLTRGRDDGGE